VQKYADWLHVQANKVRKKKMQAPADHDSPEQVNCIAVPDYAPSSANFKSL